MGAMPDMQGNTAWKAGIALVLAGVCVSNAAAAPARQRTVESPRSPVTVLDPGQWRQVDDAVDRALSWIISRQEPNGAFPTKPEGRPGVTSLCVLAMLEAGHEPGAGRCGQSIVRAVEYILRCQRSDGLISTGTLPAVVSAHNLAHTASYNHAISGLMLTQVYGMGGFDDPPRLRKAVEGAIAFTAHLQRRPKRVAKDRGGWRYIGDMSRFPSDSDLSVTAWHLKFLRSAKNAGFDVADAVIEEALWYVKRTFDYREHHTFLYGLMGTNRRPNRAMSGAGILSLAMCGVHDTKEARSAGDWLLDHPFKRYNQARVADKPSAENAYRESFHYGAFYSTRAMFQLGGRYWKEYFPPLVRLLLASQSTEGSWHPEVAGEGVYGNVYTTALIVLTLTTPNQLLPIYQR